MAMIGLIRDALQAGPYPAKSAALTRIATAIAKEAGSFRTVAVADVLEGRVRIAGRVLDAVDFSIGHTFYTGNKLPKWKGDIFVGGQRTGEIPGTGRLERILVNEKLEELRRESLLVPLGMRIRDVRQGPDELLYVVVDHDTNGGILRIEPSATRQIPTTYPTRPPR